MRGLHDAGNHTTGGVGTIIIVLSTLALVATMRMGAYFGMWSVVTAIDSWKPVPTEAKARVSVTVILGVVSAFFGIIFITASTALYDALITMLYVL